MMKTQLARHQKVVVTMIVAIGVVFSGWLDRGWAEPPRYGGTLRFVGEMDAMGFDAIKAR